MFRKTVYCALPLLALGLRAEGELTPAAPTPPPMIALPESAAFQTKAATQFSIGNPTDEEQLFLEYINRARANPNAEALRLANTTDPLVLNPISQFGVDLQEMIAQFASLPPAPPLSFDAKLMAAAAGHNQFLFDTAQQSHTGADGIDLLGRIMATAYPIRNAGENVYSYAKSVWMGHAGFQIDWGNGPFGMQTPPGHRLNVHSTVFTEVGINVITGSNSVDGRTVGPMLVTQDFGRPQTLRTFVTGVAYYDLNGNNFYDLGEGMGGVTITVDGGASFAVTSASGGYSVPVTAGGSYVVRFNAPNLAEHARAVSLNGANSLKLDLALPYTAPNITGPASPVVGIANTYTISPIAGANDYKARVRTTAPAPLEGAEASVSHLQFATTGGYAPVTDLAFASGTKAFHLAHPTSDRQLITFADDFYVAPGGRIDFQSRLGVATPTQIARVEASSDGGQNWTVIHEQAGVVNGGTDTSERTFTLRSASLAAFTGKFVKVRFAYDVSGLRYSSTDARYGWYIDDIAFINANKVASTVTITAGASGRVEFVPPAIGTYVMDAQPMNLARALPPTTAIALNSQANTRATLDRGITVARGTVTMQFDRTAAGGTSFVLQSASDPAASQWDIETNANFTTADGNRFIVTVPANGARRFYRVRSN